MVENSSHSPDGWRLTPIAGELKIVSYCLIDFPDKNQASIDKRINCPECGGDGEAGTAFHAFPVIVR
jgi:hypothetical protein